MNHFQAYGYLRGDAIDYNLGGRVKVGYDTYWVTPASCQTRVPYPRVFKVQALTDVNRGWVLPAWYLVSVSLLSRN